MKAGVCPYENAIDSSLLRWAANLSLAILIYLSCEAGRIVGLPFMGLKISIFWPATGVSLAALLLFGKQLVPGVFFGNLLYNASHLLASQPGIALPLSGGLMVSLGSTLEAAAGAFMICSLSTRTYFANLKDVFVFLIPAGVVTCLIAPSIGVLTLSSLGYVKWEDATLTWFTFWLGDTMGVYMVAPFILSWTILPGKKLSPFKWFEIVLISTGFIAVTYLSLVLDYPLTHLLIPLVLWGTFRYGLRGGSTMVLAAMIIGVVAASHGHGIFTKLHFAQPLLVLVSFFEIISGVTLIVAGSLNEREDAWRLLQNYNKNLEEIILERTKQLNAMHDAFNVKQKLISLGMITTGIGHEIKEPVNQIKRYANAGIDCLAILKQVYAQQRNLLAAETASSVENTIESLDNCMKQIIDQETKANRIVDLIIQAGASEKAGTFEVKSINLHILLTKTLDQKRHEMENLYPDFSVEIKKEYSPSIGMIDVVPEDLARVFSQILDNSWYALRKKKGQSGESFKPILTVKTTDKWDEVEIIFHDNGIGIPPAMLPRIFQPFFTTKPPEEGAGLALAIVHDIIVQEHHGAISVDSKEGLYTDVKISLPKSTT